MSDEQVSLGEVYRLCQRIETKVDKTNGNVIDHGQRLAILEDRGGRDTAARVTGAGSLIGGLIYAIYQAVAGKP